MKYSFHQTRIVIISAAMLAAPLTLHADEPLGRLFYTPEKRALLDQQRALNMLEMQQISDSPEIAINGQVRRSSGKRTIWINSQAQHDNETQTGTVTRPATRSHERVIVEQEGSATAELKVGETLNKETQETHDLIGDGKIVVQKNSRNTKQ